MIRRKHDHFQGLYLRHFTKRAMFNRKFETQNKLSNDMLFVLNGQIERLKELSKDILFVLNGQIERML